MSSRPLKRSAVYGPIKSKRLGRSLGVNLLPPDKKVCSFDCVYCHYGRTKPGPYDLPRPDTIVEEVKKALQEKPELDYITFAGHGEPTLHMEILDIFERIKDLRDELLPDVKIALLTNSSKLYRPDVARVCRLIDAPICKLDAGDDRTFRRVNRPRPNIYLEDVIRSIKGTANAVIQAMIVEGAEGNAGDAEIDSLIDAVKEASPTFVQVYSIDFPLPDGSLDPVPNEKLARIASRIREKAGIDAEAFWESN